jgi:hypothetical protein
VLHYCVDATLPYALKLANNGTKVEVRGTAGKLTYEAVAVSQNKEYTPLDELL